MAAICVQFRVPVFGSGPGYQVPLEGSGVTSGVSASQYAAHRGVSDTYVRRLRREGRLVLLPDGKIDQAASDALLAATCDPLRGGDRTGKEPGAPMEPRGAEAPLPGTGAPPVPVPGINLQEAVRRERLAKARSAELELGEQAKELTRVKDVKREVFTLARQGLERLRTMGSRLRGKLAAESDPRACEALIDAEVRQVCEDLQAGADRLAGRLGPQVVEEAA